MDRIATKNMQTLLQGTDLEGNAFRNCGPGVKGTPEDADYKNGLMFELLNTIIKSGQTPIPFDDSDPNSYNQLWLAILAASKDETQTTAWTGLDTMPVGSISPLMFSSTGMSTKWTFANGSKIPETQPIIDWFNNDTLGFIANWNSTCSLVGAAQITLADGFLTVPDLISWGAYLRAGSNGILQADAFKSHTHKGDMALQGEPSAHGGRPIGVGNKVNWGAYIPSVQHSGGSETRPVNIAMPTYFKIA